MDNEIETVESRIAGAKGALRVTDSTPAVEVQKGVVQAEVLSTPNTITGKDSNNDPINFKTDPRYMWTAFYPGLPYSTRIGDKITDIDLSSGSIVCY